MIATPHIVKSGDSDTYPLGVLSMRLLAGAGATGGAFALAEFSGSEGAWTVPHLHREGEESFYVLDGTFTFDVGQDEVEAQQGSFIVVPRGTRHQMRAHPGGGRFLTLWTPAGPEEMFRELSRLPADSIRDPEVRRALAARFDSIPV